MMQENISKQIQEKIQAIFPNWKAVEIIGAGINSTVYRIRCAGEKDQALKIVSNAGARQEIAELQQKGASFANEFKKGMILNWERETDILRTVNACPYTVQTYEQVIQPDESGVPEYYIRMELLDTLTDVIPAMTVKDAVKMAIDICEAIDFCNQREIIHCDIKPANIFRDANGSFKLGDFSSALYTSETNRPPRNTELFAAPETKDEGSFGKTIDLYSLGLVLFGLLNGQYPPFIEDISKEAPPSDEQIQHSIETRLHEARDVGKACQAPGDLNEILNIACSYYPNDRYQSAGEFMTALKKRLASLVDKGNEPLLFPARMHPVRASGQTDAENHPLNELTKNDGPIRDISVFGTMHSPETGSEEKNKKEKRAQPSKDESADREETSTDRINQRISTIHQQIAGYKQKREDKTARKKKRRIMIVAFLLFAAIAAALVFLLLRSGKVANIAVRQNGCEMEVTWSNGGSGPWSVSVLRDGNLLFEKQADQRQAVFQLAPGYHYTVQVAGESVEAPMSELPRYDAGDILLRRVELQYYRVKTDGAMGALNDADQIEYSPLIGTVGERGYLLSLAYEMPSGDEIQALCFLVLNHGQAVQTVSFSPSEWLQFGDVPLNDALKTYINGDNALTYKVYIGNSLLAQGTFDILMN